MLAAVAVTALAAPAAAQSADRAVFVVNNVSDQITSLAMAANGTLSVIGNTPTSDGPTAAALSPSGRWLAVTHGTANEVTEVLQIFEVASDATLAHVLTTTVPDSPLDCAWLSDAILAVVKTSLSGANAVNTYLFNGDPETPILTFVDTGATGSFSTSLAVHPSAPLLFAQDSTGDTVSWFEFDAGGMLSPLGSIPTGSTFPLELAIAPSGAHLYAACGISGDGHRVLGFDVDLDEGLTPIPGSPFFSPGQSPANLAVTPDGAFVFVGHGTDATVRSFAVDGIGALTPTGFSFDVGLQGTVGDVQVLGAYLLVTDESSAIDGITGIYSFAIAPDGSFAAVGPIVVTGGVRPERIVAWDPEVPGDVDGDGVVGFADLLMVLSDWGRAGGPADVDGDGIVGFRDLLIVLSSWTE
jgi:6-phosphogluconolactonase (cycloisomerase 2 family)